MTIDNDLRKSLLAGGTTEYSNEDHQLSIGGDDIRFAQVYYQMSGPSWAQGYKIMFNGELLHSSKGFNSMKTRLQKLGDKWNMEEVEDLEPLNF